MWLLQGEVSIDSEGKDRYIKGMKILWASVDCTLNKERRSFSRVGKSMWGGSDILAEA